MIEAIRTMGMVFKEMSMTTAEAADRVSAFFKAALPHFTELDKPQSKKQRHLKRYQRMMARQVKIRFYKIR